MPQDPTQQEMEQIGNAIAAGSTIAAIKLYREITGCGLRESKDFIEKLTDELRSSQPERFATRHAPPNQQVLIFWILWFAFLMSQIVIYHILGKQLASKQELNPSFWIAGAIPVILSTINRWMILPRFKKTRIVLSLFIIGVAFAQSILFQGLILFPASKGALFALSFAGVLQYIPVFAGKLTN